MFFQGNEKYNCATYLRLSRSDGDQQESNSIKNQRALLNDYMGKHPELHKFDEYVDDGYSGTNFERPDFKRMMQDIEKRNVNCIIVKDLSRFGRNYIETGRYLERIFPFMGVRFIAINDHYDSAEENDDKGRINKRTIIGWERDGRYPRSIEMLEKMADIFHVPLTYLQPDQSLFIERAAEAYGKKGKIEAQHLAFELTELFASGELTPQDMDGIMYEMHKAYFKYREQKREKERIMNL